MTATPAVLFVCVHNAGRSQMAAGYLAGLAGGGSRSAPPGPCPATRSTPSPSRPWPKKASTSPRQTPKIVTTESVQASEVRDHHGLR